MMEKPAESKQQKARLLRKLLVLLLQRAAVVSTLCYVMGIVGVLLLPAIAKETYVDENALSPGMAAAGGQYDDIQSLKVTAGQTSKGTVQDWVVRQLKLLGVDSYSHTFSAPAPSRCSSSSNQSSLNTRQASMGIGLGQNVVGVVQAPKGEGNECLVLVTPVSETNTEADAIAVAISYGVFRHLATVSWLAKDVIWVVADGRYGADYALSSWLSDYHSPLANSTGRFLRGGAIQAAVALKIDRGYRTGGFDLVELRAEGPNGEMPNMDMISTVTFLNRYQPTHGGLRFELARWRGLSKVFGPFLPLLRWAAGEIGRTTAQEYDRHVEMLAACMHRQAVGASSGVHGAFRRYTIDALTLVAKPSGNNRDAASQTSASAAAARQDQARSILKVARLLEGYFRCLNNLLERLHHSSSLYVLASPTRFVSIGDYMIPFALLLATLPLTAAALATQGFKSFYSGPVAGFVTREQSEGGENRRSGDAEPVARTGEAGEFSDGVAGAGVGLDRGSRKSGELASGDVTLGGGDVTQLDPADAAQSRQEGVGFSSGKAVSGKPLSVSDCGLSESAPVVGEPVLLLPANWTRATATVAVAHLAGVFLWRVSPPLLELGAAASHWLQTPVELMSVAVWAVGAAAVLASAVVAVPVGKGKIVPSANELDKAGAQGRMVGSELATGRVLGKRGILPVETVGDFVGGEAENPDGEREQTEGESQCRTLRAEWVSFKSATLAAAGLALGALVNLDYALALLSAVCLVPICLVAQPMRLVLSSDVPLVSKDALSVSKDVQLVSDNVRSVPNDVKVGAKEVVKSPREKVAASTGTAARGQQRTEATQSEGLEVTQSQSQSVSEDWGAEQSPSMAALCAQVREELTGIRDRRQKARAHSGMGRLKSAMVGGARWVLDKRRAFRNRVKGKPRQDVANARGPSRKAILRQVVLTLAALLVTPGPFLVLACEQGKAPSLGVLLERIGRSESVAMPWLIAGYLPIVALSVRTLFLPPFTTHER